jgi:hypothetical protein
MVIVDAGVSSFQSQSRFQTLVSAAFFSVNLALTAVRNLAASDAGSSRYEETFQAPCHIRAKRARLNGSHACPYLCGL